MKIKCSNAATYLAKKENIEIFLFNSKLMTLLHECEWPASIYTHTTVNNKMSCFNSWNLKKYAGAHVKLLFHYWRVSLLSEFCQQIFRLKGSICPKMKMGSDTLRLHDRDSKEPSPAHGGSRLDQIWSVSIQPRLIDQEEEYRNRNIITSRQFPRTILS